MSKNFLMRLTWICFGLTLLVTGCVAPPVYDDAVEVSEARIGVQTSDIRTDGPCASLTSISWSEITLYELTYRCLPAGWSSFFNRDNVRKLVYRISNKLNQTVDDGFDISPQIGNTFRALYIVGPVDVRAVIMGQDPAPQPGLATGLSFSLESGRHTKDVASVQRVFLEAQNNGFCVNLADGDASEWAYQGVLLLNMALTIPCPAEESSCTIGEHRNMWRDFTVELVKYLNELDRSIAFIH